MNIRLHPQRLSRLASLLMLFGIVAIAVSATTSSAEAQCTPAASTGPTLPAAGTTVTCSGTTTNQNGSNGYGTGNQDGLTIDVLTGATVTGTGNPSTGIAIDSGNTINNAGAISAFSNGVTAVGDITVNNIGSGTTSDSRQQPYG